MTEELLHYIWKYRLFNPTDLHTVSGDKLSVIKTGKHNQDSGPDFFDARIRIGETTWAGNLEIHIKTSDWQKHRHDKDDAYKNVILHVVFEDDAKTSEKSIPTLVLKNRIDKNLVLRYSNFLNNKSWIPCEKQIKKAGTLVKKKWLERLTIERLERKSQILLDDLKFSGNDWAETFYIHLARNFGMKINAEPFSLLAKSIPYSILCKHKDNPEQIEALLFGQAGFIKPHNSSLKSAENQKKTYYSTLQKEYNFLRKKYSLNPLDVHVWKFMRLRPAAFPTIRISQLAALVFQSSSVFSKILVTTDVDQLKAMFRIPASNFWDDHYVFSRKSSFQKKKLGNNAIDVLIINAVVPFLFIYGKRKGNEMYCDQALKFLEQTAAEKNSITERWKSLDFKIENSFESQALLELKNEYCSYKKCLSCGIGMHLLKR